MKNTLYYGDNLPILREYIADASVDLVYLDPPFNSSRTYNVLFKEEGGQESDAQIAAFEDTWHWTQHTEEVYYALLTEGRPEVATVIEAMRKLLGTSQMMAYLVMMAVRLAELHRVLKPTGSLYLHCDPTASHYLKIVLDTVFGPENFRNEIVWRRYGTHNDTGQGSRHFGRVHDTILFYTRSSIAVWTQMFTSLDPNYVEKTYRYVDQSTGRPYSTTPLTGPGGAEKGNPVFEWKGHTRAWRYNRETMERLDSEGKLHYSKTGYARQKLFLEDSKGIPVQDWWNDISALTGTNAERLGYPTQKPVELLKRIVAASSNEGDVVLDPFCGCGTTIAAAQELNRRWIGIDITHLSIALQKYRLRDAFNLVAGQDYQVIGEPASLNSARQLAADDRYQFQFWALSLIQARPLGGEAGGKKGKKGADRGIDGIINFVDDGSGKAKRVLVQVKSGNVSSAHIRDLVGTVQREDAALGVYITLDPPTTPMLTEAASAGFYESPGWRQTYPKIQILTVEDLLNGAAVKMPPSYTTFRQAEKVNRQPEAAQAALDLDA